MDGTCGTNGGKINVYGIFVEKPNDLEDLDTDGKGIIFQLVLKEQDDKLLGDLSGSGRG
jgi:hypothetical protein